MTEHLTDVKELLQIAETIEHRPVLGHWPHMRAASDAAALRRAAAELQRLREELHREVGTRAARTAEIDHLRRRAGELGRYVNILESQMDRETLKWCIKRRGTSETTGTSAGFIDDGLGNQWPKCKPDCRIRVVRPGHADCDCHGTPETTGESAK